MAARYDIAPRHLTFHGHTAMPNYLSIIIVSRDRWLAEKSINQAENG